MGQELSVMDNGMGEERLGCERVWMGQISSVMEYG